MNTLDLNSESSCWLHRTVLQDENESVPAEFIFLILRKNSASKSHQGLVW